MQVVKIPKGIPKNGINKGWFKRKSSLINYNGYKIFYDKKGYPIVWIEGKNKKVHTLEWEKHNGKKPKNFDIHHIDFNKKNWNINNLELLTCTNHKRLHAGWIRDNNNNWIAKPCNKCNNILSIDKFIEGKKTIKNYCKSCRYIIFKNKNTLQYRLKRKDYMRKYYENNKIKWKN